MGSPFYRYGQWGYLELDPSSGRTASSIGPADRLYIPGSSTKLFSVSATLDYLGFDHRFKTPVYVQGKVENGTLHGNLVLVASGDLTMGGRTAPNGTLSYTDIDHTYADSVPGATLTPENPLAGIDEIARQVRKSGIKHVKGNAVIDDRLFDVAPQSSVDALSFNAPSLDPWPDPIAINDNLIDFQVKPGQVGEKPKVVRKTHRTSSRSSTKSTTSPLSGRKRSPTKEEPPTATNGKEAACRDGDEISANGKHRAASLLRRFQPKEC
jgi:D-alanyl-D-alanine carboxypeptidase/D-alanyl-D-alanine-endopeptidase (penicillin-binding protein 4)